MREILIDITLAFFTLYGAGSFALDVFKWATPKEQKTENKIDRAA